jgi:hypothetical protein
MVRLASEGNGPEREGGELGKRVEIGRKCTIEWLVSKVDWCYAVCYITFYTIPVAKGAARRPTWWGGT